MRKVEYLSPTSISKFYSNITEFYLTYLSDNRPEKIGQTKPMAIGSAFDAYAKSYLYDRVIGDKNSKFDFTTLFEAQVEPQNRDIALVDGKRAFDLYLESGALGDLMIELNSAIGLPRFEIDIRGIVEGKREGVTKNIGGVMFLGKPDVFFINRHGVYVIFDWKCNGYYSYSPPPPMPGYVRLRQKVSSKYVNVGQHRNAQPMNYGGVMVNYATTLDLVNQDWARQLSIYSWLCGMEIGAKFIAAIDQLVSNDIRVAEHRLHVSEAFQWDTYAKAEHVWDVVTSNHIFRDLTLEQSQERCHQLDTIGSALKGDGSPEDKWFNQIARS